MSTLMSAIEVILAVVVIAFGLYLFVLVRPSKPRAHDRKFLTDYAHRGLHGNGIPENSIAAFNLAAEHGFGIELDVQLSRDGEVMVFHDYTLERMTGRKAKLSELTAAELSSLRLGGGNERIPTLREVLSVVDGRVPLLVELKGESSDVRTASETDKILSVYKGSYCIESFNPLLVGWYAKHRPEVFRGILYTNVCTNKKPSVLNLLLTLMALNRVAKPQFISYDEKYRRLLPVVLCTRFYSAAKFVWTIRSGEVYTTDKTSDESAIFEGFIPPGK